MYVLRGEHVPFSMCLLLFEIQNNSIFITAQSPL